MIMHNTQTIYTVKLNFGAFAKDWKLEDRSITEMLGLLWCAKIYAKYTSLLRNFSAKLMMHIHSNNLHSGICWDSLPRCNIKFIIAIG